MKHFFVCEKGDILMDYGIFRLPETPYKKNYCHYEPLHSNGVVISLL
ncbi:MAG: hypothetical protein IKI11_02135 [Neisseriaceae bacterium]|nr:hypothetical protein [Neisseriaceae bacterium]